MADDAVPYTEASSMAQDPNGPQPGRLDRPGAPSLAYVRLPAPTGRATVVFCGGFLSAMSGTKATFLQELCGGNGLGFVRFDYSGHGESDGRFEDGTIGLWLAETLTVLDQLTDGPVVLVGSSMGAWIATHAAQQRRGRIGGLVLLAPAIDFTQDIVWARLDGKHRAQLGREGRLTFPSAYGDQPDVITRELIEEGRKHLLLDKPVSVGVPVRVLHGMQDGDIPWRQSLRLMERLTDADARLTLIKDAEHRLQRPQDLAMLAEAVLVLAEDAPAKARQNGEKQVINGKTGGTKTGDTKTGDTKSGGPSAHQAATPAAPEDDGQDAAEEPQDAGQQQ